MITIRTEVGIEQYWNTEGLTRNAGCIVYGYGFLTSDGELFQCVKPTLEACRAERDEWLTQTP